MKAKELMIGDWVYNTHNQQNERVQEIGSGLVMLNYNDLYEYEEIESIPLTTEILEKNGWVYNNEDEKFFPKTWVGGGLMLQGSDDCGYCIVVTSDYDDEDTNDTPFIILYVHELQHALMLRRIEKEIVL